MASAIGIAAKTTIRITSPVLRLSADGEHPPRVRAAGRWRNRRDRHRQGRAGIPVSFRHPAWLTDQSIGSPIDWSRTQRSARALVDFTLTDEQKDLRELAHDFAEKEIRPVAWDYDRDAPGPRRSSRRPSRSAS